MLDKQELELTRLLKRRSFGKTETVSASKTVSSHFCVRESYKRVQADSTYSSKSKFLILSRLIDISKELCSLAWLLLLCKLKTSELLVQQQQVKRTSDPY